MAFTRKFLLEQGVPEDKIDIILGERNRTMADYVLKSDVEEQIKNAVQKATENITFDVTTTNEYQALQNQVEMYKTLDSKEFDNVKKPYREIVWGKLDHSEKHAPYEEQLTGIKESMPDLFVVNEAVEEEQENKPQFASGTQGSIPSGKEAPSFSDYWKFK